MGKDGNIKTKEEMNEKMNHKNETKKESKNEPRIDEKNEVIKQHIAVPLKVLIQATKAVCKIRIEANGGITYGTGFFIKYSDSKKFLVTWYNVINRTLENDNIELEIHNNKMMKLQFNNRFTKYISKPKDIAIIEIKESDEIYNEVEYLNYDLNFMNGGYSIYKNADVFTIEFPGGEDSSCASGKIKDIYDN